MLFFFLVGFLHIGLYCGWFFLAAISALGICEQKREGDTLLSPVTMWCQSLCLPQQVHEGRVKVQTPDLGKCVQIEGFTKGQDQLTEAGLGIRTEHPWSVLLEALGFIESRSWHSDRLVINLQYEFSHVFTYVILSHLFNFPALFSLGLKWECNSPGGFLWEMNESVHVNLLKYVASGGSS